MPAAKDCLRIHAYMFAGSQLSIMISIYIHIPFCVRKCNYCDFLSFAASDDMRERYVAALCDEIRLYSKDLSKDSKEIYTVFFGGGTPSLLTSGQINRIMETIHEGFRVIDKAEVSMECNPGTVKGDILRSLRESGINRLSIGLQSAIDSELKALGRIHDYEGFVRTYSEARDAGFDNINIDIMSGIPGQTLKTYEKTLTEVVNANPQHISAYSLIIEEGTKFADLYGADRSVSYTNSAILPLPDEDDERRLYYMTGDILKAAGYDRYEISNYARPGYECRHNNVYWTGGEYIGVGLGASSYFRGYRYKNTSVINEYLEDIEYISDRDIPVCYDVFDEYKDSDYKGYCGLHDEVTFIEEKDAMEEYMFLGLRRMQGISMEGFRLKFGHFYNDIYGSETDRLISEGLIEKDGDMIRLTPKGIDVSNSVFVRFLLD